jgi:hypothetical protein
VTQGPQRQGEGRQERNRRAAEERHIAGAINALNRTYKAAEDKRDQYDNTNQKWARRIAVTTVVTAGIAAAALACTVFSIFQTGHSLKIAREAVKEARRQADEAQKQTDLVRQNLISSRRPWLDFADGPQIDEPLNFFGSNGASLSIKTSARNLGNSPAIDVAFTNTTYFDEWPAGNITEVISKYICKPEKMNYSGAPFVQLISPNDTQILWPSKSVKTDIDKNQLQAPHAWMSLCIRYEDEFGNPHSTGQLFIYIPNDGKPIPASPSGPIAGTLKAYAAKIMK